MLTEENVRRAVPESVDAFVTLVSEPRNRRRITAWLERDAVGVSLEDAELPNLPGSMLGVMTGSGKTSVGPLLTNAKSHIETEWIITGKQGVTIEIEDGEETKGEGRKAREK